MQWLKAGLLCLAWYSVSALNNIVGKVVLTELQLPMTLTFVQLLSISVLSVPLLHFYGKTSSAKHLLTVTSKKYKSWVLLLAVGKFLSLVSGHVAIWKIPVSYAHTVKATMPLFTVTLTRLLFGDRYSNRVYFSLFPIVLGVTLSTLTEINFDLLGLLTALASTFLFSLQNMFSKRLLKISTMHEFELLFLLAVIALGLYSPLYLLLDGSLFLGRIGGRIALLLMTDGMLSFLQNLLAFTFLGAVSPLTYAIANASKRLVIIFASVVFFANSVGPINVIGMIIALAGLALYGTSKGSKSRSDYDNKQTLLPLYFNNNNYI